MGDAQSGPIHLSFNSQLRVEFRGALSPPTQACYCRTNSTSAAASVP